MPKIYNFNSSYLKPIEYKLKSIDITIMFIYDETNFQVMETAVNFYYGMGDWSNHGFLFWYKYILSYIPTIY